MLGLDAAGKTTILYKLHIGEVLSTVPTIGRMFLMIMLLPSYISKEFGLSKIFILRALSINKCSGI